MAKNKEKLLISVITVCLNDAEKLGHTIQNVLRQKYKNKEFIIIDGGSKDDSVGVIKKYKHAVDHWISEKDEGIYDAMNKGINISHGDVLHFLNAGDYYYSEDVLEAVTDVFNKKKDIGIVYGLAESFSEYEDLKYINGGKVDKNRLWKGMPVCHQSMFFRKDVFKILGGYDLDYSSMADYEFLLRFVHKNDRFRAYYIGRVLSGFDLYGFSSENYLKNLSEIENLSKKYYHWDLRKKIYFVVKKIKFYPLILIKKTGIYKIYRKIKYHFFYKLMRRVKYDDKRKKSNSYNASL